MLLDPEKADKRTAYEKFVDAEIAAPKSAAAFDKNISALAYWGKILLRDIKDGWVNDIALSRVAYIVLSMGNPDLHEEWAPVHTKTGEKHKINIERIGKCYSAYSELLGFDVVYNEDGDPAAVKITGHRACENETLCARCGRVAAKKNEEKINAILDFSHEHNYKSFMLTLTAPHSMDTDDRVFVHRLGDAWRRIVKCKPYKRLRHKYGVCAGEVGKFGLDPEMPFVKAFEETIGGPSGGHYHYHLLFVYMPPAGVSEFDALKEIREVFSELWQTYAVKVGLVLSEAADPIGWKHFVRRGVDLRRVKDKDEAAAYVSKIDRWDRTLREWSAAKELTFNVVKQGHGGGYTPNELLLKIALHDVPAYYKARRHGRGPAALAALWRDILCYLRFAMATWRRKNVDFSNGLKSWIEIQNAKKPKESAESETVCGMHAEGWEYIRKLGLIPHVKAVVLAGPEEILKLSDHLEKLGFGALVSGVEVADLREKESRKRELAWLYKHGRAKYVAQELLEKLAECRQKREDAPQQLSLLDFVDRAAAGGG